MTIRQSIVDELMTLFAAITVANGYQTNVGMHLFEWRDAPLSVDELPALVLRDLDDEIQPSQGGFVLDNELSQLSLSLDILVTDVGSDTAIEIVRKAFDDVSKAIRLAYQDTASNLSGLVVDIRRVARRVVVDQNSLKVAGGLFEFLVIYNSAQWNES